MRQFDETEAPKTESEQLFEHVSAAVDKLSDEIYELLEQMNERVDQLALRVANLEARKPPQDTNPDPEWYS